MKVRARANFARLSLPLIFSLLMLFMLLYSLYQVTKAEPGFAYSKTLQEFDDPNGLDPQTGVSACAQTPNLAPNPGFEKGDR